MPPILLMHIDIFLKPGWFLCKLKKPLSFYWCVDLPASETGDKRLPDGLQVLDVDATLRNNCHDSYPVKLTRGCQCLLCWMSKIFLYGCAFEGCSSQDVPVALQCLEEMLKKRRKQVQKWKVISSIHLKFCSTLTLNVYCWCPSLTAILSFLWLSQWNSEAVVIRTPWSSLSFYQKLSKESDRWI